MINFFRAFLNKLKEEKQDNCKHDFEKSISTLTEDCYDKKLRYEYINKTCKKCGYKDYEHNEIILEDYSHIKFDIYRVILNYFKNSDNETFFLDKKCRFGHNKRCLMPKGEHGVTICPVLKFDGGSEYEVPFCEFNPSLRFPMPHDWIKQICFAYCKNEVNKKKGEKMSSFGEKFLVKKIEGNKVIKISEWKEFEDNFDDIVQDINDYITDDPEELYYNYGIVMVFDSFVWLDCDACIDGINEFLENCDEDELEEYEWLQGYLYYLRKAEGFTIYLKNEAKDYE